MIKFFRHIRRALIEQNKMGKYFKYALGEITLVMIGILLALQVNNWNENRKDKNYELKMLSELKVALENDLKHHNRMIRRVNIADSATTKLIQYYHRKVVFNDSLYPLFGRMRTGIQWQQNYGPYQSVKSKGIDKISSDTLRKALVNFYDFRYPRNIELLKWYDKNYDDQLKRLQEFLQEPYTTLNKRDSIVIYRDYQKDVLSNPDFLLLLKDFKSRNTNTLRNLKYTRKDINDLLIQLNQHL